MAYALVLQFLGFVLILWSVWVFIDEKFGVLSSSLLMLGLVLILISFTYI